MCLCQEINLQFLTTFEDAGWELHGTRWGPGQRESAALILLLSVTATSYVPKRFTNLMCIICKSYFIELCPHILLLYVAVYENTKEENCTPYSLCVRVPPNHKQEIQTGLIHVPLFIYQGCCPNLNGILQMWILSPQL